MSERELRVRIVAKDSTRGITLRTLSAATSHVKGVLKVTVDDEQFDATIKAHRTSYDNVLRAFGIAVHETPERTVTLVTGPRRCYGLAHHGDAEMVASNVRAATALADVLLSFVDPPVGTPWEHSSEELIRRLYLLLDQKDALLERLTQAYDRDRETAQARIAELEHQLAALEAERLRTDVKRRDPHVIGTIAIVIATILGPIAGVVLDHALEKPVADVVTQAQQVQADCNVTINTAP